MAMVDITGPIEIYRGDTFTFQIAVTGDDGSAESLAGAAVEVQVKQELNAPDPPLIDKSIANGGIILEPDSGDTVGVATCTFSSAETNVEPGTYWIDIVGVFDGARGHLLAPTELVIKGSVNIP